MSPPKVDPEELQLRAAPRRAVRFKRGLLIGIAALCSGAILAVTMMALKGPALRIKEQAEELYNTERKPTPDGLAALPSDYSQTKPQTPILGPPLPGDLGRPILSQQRAHGLMPGSQEFSAEEQRLLQQAVQARESGVFFRISVRPQPPVTAGAGQVEWRHRRSQGHHYGLTTDGWRSIPRLTRITSSASSISLKSATRAASTIRMRCRRPLRPIRSWREASSRRA